MPEPARLDLSQAIPLPANVNPDLDPRLQLYVAQSQAGMVRAASTSTTLDEVAVVARVGSPDHWEALSEVRQPLVIGPTRSGDCIVTGRIPIRRIESVRRQDFVHSLKAGQTLHPLLDATVTETEATPALLPPGHLARGGAGVVVGIIDYGCDFVHLNFRHRDGSSRIDSLWYQDGPATFTSPLGYGRQFTTLDLNIALQQPDPYGHLGYYPAWFENPQDPGSHGTHVMDIAAGNGLGTGVAGMAPEADLVFVNISHAQDPLGVARVGQSFGDSVRLLEAVKYIFDRAGNRPCVVNISLGTNGGPHDGTTLVEQGIDSLLAAAPNRAVTIAAANAYDDGIHASATVGQGQTVELDWEVRSIPTQDIELEVWYAGADRLTVELLGPQGEPLALVSPGRSTVLQTPQGQVAVLVANRLDDPNNHDNMIGVFLAAGMPVGTYKLRLRGDQVTDGRLHAWIERDNRFHSRFAPPHDNSHTIGSVSCGRLSLAVGSYDGHKSSRPVSYFSSAGPTRDGRPKPEVSAPGHSVRAALSGSRNGSRLMSGTSMAAPAVAGLIALMLAEARTRGMGLTVGQIRDILLETARRDPPTGSGWDDRYGQGRVSAAKALRRVMELAGGS